jgi:hypothetical protein
MAILKHTAIAALCASAFLVAQPGLADDKAVAVSARFWNFVAHVEVIGDLYNGDREVEAGSGLLVGGRYVITNNHILPDSQNYKTQTINVRLGSRLHDPLAVSEIVRDPDRDLALLHLTKVVPDFDRTKCPVQPVLNPTKAPPGTTLFLLGYPLNEDLSIASGLISNQTSEEGKRWQTDTVMNPGNSGGPAFTPEGFLAGLAVGGIVKWWSGGEERRAEGVNFIIPSTIILASPLLDKLAAAPFEERCWDGSATALTRVLEPDEKAPPTFSRSFTVSRTKEDHPYPFKTDTDDYPAEMFAAEPGYRVIECVIQPVSANHANTSCKIADDGNSASFNLSLTSGPLYDQWRGWFDGTVIVKQALR